MPSYSANLLHRTEVPAFVGGYAKCTGKVGTAILCGLQIIVGMVVEGDIYVLVAQMQRPVLVQILSCVVYHVSTIAAQQSFLPGNRSSYGIQGDQSTMNFYPYMQTWNGD